MSRNQFRTDFQCFFREVSPGNQKCHEIHFGPIFKLFSESPGHSISTTSQIFVGTFTFFQKSVPRTPRSANKLISDPFFFLFYRDWTELTPRRTQPRPTIAGHRWQPGWQLSTMAGNVPQLVGKSERWATMAGYGYMAVCH